MFCCASVVAVEKSDIERVGTTESILRITSTPDLIIYSGSERAEYEHDAYSDLSCRLHLHLRGSLICLALIITLFFMNLARSSMFLLNIELSSEMAASDTGCFSSPFSSSQDRVAFCACMNAIRARKK